MEAKVKSVSSGKEFLIDSLNPLMMGRGPDFEAPDKRISRKHGELVVSSDGLQLTALHCNPCFVMRGGLPPILVVKKGDTLSLQQGDHISLLPDLGWFHISIINNTDDSGSLRLTEADSSGPVITERAETPKSKDKILSDASPSLGQVCWDDFHEDLDTTNLIDDAQAATSSLSDKPRKSRKLPDWMLEDGELPAKKQALESSNSLDACCPSFSKKTRLPISMYFIDGDEVSSASTGSSLNSHANTTKKPELAAAKVKEELKEHSQQEVNTSALGSNFTTSTAYEKPSSSKTMDLSSPISSSSERNTALPEQQSKSTAQLSLTAEAIKTEAPPISEQQQQPMPSLADVKPTIKVEPAVVPPTSPQLSQSPTPTQRELCQYGANCYRRNEQHKAMLSHPGDPDWLPPERRPICEFGPSCYRRNPAHRFNYSHPTLTVAVLRNIPNDNESSSESSTVADSLSSGYYVDTDADEDVEDPWHTDAASDSDYFPSQNSTEE